jgi:N,N'-diacetyllegionaminate synthase
MGRKAKMIHLGDRPIGEGAPVFFIAEAGVNHNGSLKMAKELIDVAVEAGADAVKFQTYVAENVMTKDAEKASYQKEVTGSGETQYEMVKKMELNEEQHQELVEHCRRRGIMFLSTPFDFASIELLAKLEVPAYKISSGDLTNLPFLRALAEKKKPIILSTGLATLGEVEEAVQCIEGAGCHDLILLHCTTSYPTQYRDVNLRAMLTLKHAFQLPVGYSDHTPGSEVALAAVALGARIIEKHFTLDKNLPGPDHRASLEPAELKSCIAAIRNIEAALGDGIKRCMAGELVNRDVARKSIVALQEITKGTVLTKELIGIKRPGHGIPPKYYEQLIGKVAKRTIKADQVMEFSDVEW